MFSRPSKQKRQIILIALFGTLAGLVAFFFSLILQTHREYKNFKVNEFKIEQKLTQARKEFDYKEIYLELLEDPEFLERVARERLGYARPDELLFRFSDEF